MGRKGMKSFLKGSHKQHGSDDEAAETFVDQPSTSGPKPAAAAEQQDAQKAPQQAKLAEKADNRDKVNREDEDSDEEGSDSKGPETRGKVLQRHKREMVAHKKAVQKLGSKKKDEAAKLTAAIEARHTRELAELEERENQQQLQPQPAAAAAGGEVQAAVEGAAEQLAGLAVGAAAAADHKKPTKAQKRREKMVQQEAEREQRIASEQASLGPSEKAVEEEQLQALLLPLKLVVKEIRADGHCLYRAVEDQLVQAEAGAGGDGAAGEDYLALRRLAASHMRSNPDDFVAFIYDEDAAGSPDEQLEGYCQELESTAVWGGQLELGALAQALKKQIKVYATGMPTVTLGDEHSSCGVLQLCYLRHAFGLGAHYNSVVALRAEDGEGGVDS